MTAPCQEICRGEMPTTVAEGYARRGDTLAMTDCVVVDNVAAVGPQGTSGGGGGILCAYNSTTLTDCRVSGNTTKSNGGGIIADGSLYVTNSAITSNTAYSGGGIYTGSVGALKVTDSILAGNTATNGGATIPRNTAWGVVPSTLRWPIAFSPVTWPHPRTVTRALAVPLIPRAF